MTDPVRLLESADDFERALLGSAKRDAGSERALGRALAAVSGALVTLGTTGAAGATAGAVSVAKWLGAGALLGVMTTGAATLVQDQLRHEPAGLEAQRQRPVLAGNSEPLARRPPSPTQPAEPAPEPPSAPALATPASAAPSAQPALQSAPSALARPSGAASAPPSGTALTRELELLESARQSLNHGDPAGALATLSLHRAEFPSATLGPEAELLEIQAYGERGDVASAQRIGRDFLLLHPSGPYAARAHGLLDALRAR